MAKIQNKTAMIADVNAMELVMSRSMPLEISEMNAGAPVNPRTTLVGISFRSRAV